MRRSSYKALVYFIGVTIVATIGLQLYWNIQNYRVNKQRLINEVQISLDNGVEAYYSQLAKTDFFAFVSNPVDSLFVREKHITFWDRLGSDSTFLEIEKKRDSVHVLAGMKRFTQLLDSGNVRTVKSAGQKRKHAALSVFQGRSKVDSIQTIQGLANKIIISITRDSIDFKRLDTLFSKELARKEINISYLLKHFDHDSVIGSFEKGKATAMDLQTISKSTYLPDTQKLQLLYSNPTLVILKRSLTSICLSLLLSICIISCLLFLLHTIHKQKQLAEIKNDLISNITHEFKTPIATVFTAIEGIKNFNEANDTAKTEKYLDLSNQQLLKLNHMVEKLLETATLDSDKLLLNKEDTDLVFLLRAMVDKYCLLHHDKHLHFKTTLSELSRKVDPFHFENAIANLVDNAIKYGGNSIEVHLNLLLERIEITVADNGAGIDKVHREKIFDKFYRIPTGNRHDVKGFGIGLFYTKKIIEKHGGTIRLDQDAKTTFFKIVL